MVKTIKVSSKDEQVIHSLLEIFINNNEEEDTSLPHLQKLLRDDRTYLFAALEEQQPIGYALVYRFPSLYSDDNLAYLYDIEVLESHRQKGIGRQLIGIILTHLKSDEVEELWLGTALANKAGQALFTSTGAERSEETFKEFIYYISD